MMTRTVKNVISKYFKAEVMEISPLGGGFYGKVFLAVLDKAPFEVVVKIFLRPDLVRKESSLLKLLAEHALVAMPEVYGIHIADQLVGFDVLMMSFLPGVNAGFLEELPREHLDAIGEKMVDNLISYHQTTNPKGFGEIDADDYCEDWQQFYKPKAKAIVQSAFKLFEAGELDEKTYEIVKAAYERFDDIFYLPITKSSLLHGDYNTWNIMLNEELTDVSAVIDPFGGCWGDPEYDLYQLDNGNGPHFSLLERYKRKCPVSENFELKNCFYALFTEIMHYHDADVAVTDSWIPEAALKLEMKIKELLEEKSD